MAEGQNGPRRGRFERAAQPSLILQSLDSIGAKRQSLSTLTRLPYLSRHQPGGRRAPIEDAIAGVVHGSSNGRTNPNSTSSSDTMRFSRKPCWFRDTVARAFVWRMPDACWSRSSLSCNSGGHGSGRHSVPVAVPLFRVCASRVGFAGGNFGGGHPATAGGIDMLSGCLTNARAIRLVMAGHCVASFGQCAADPILGIGNDGLLKRGALAPSYIR